jgi:hypothetical protein
MASDWRKRGFERLWRRVVRDARAQIDNTRPVVANAIRAVSADAPTPEQAVSRALKIGADRKVVLPNRRAIEAGAAYRLSVAKLSNVESRSQRLAGTPHGRRDISELDLVLDSWWIYLHRHIEATRKFVNESVKALGSGKPGARRFVDEVRAWEASKKKTLAPGREEVAHANTNWIRGIDEEGLWLPMVVLELVGPETLDAMAENGRDSSSSEFFFKWNEALVRAARSSVHEADTWCEQCDSLLRA